MGIINPLNQSHKMVGELSLCNGISLAESFGRGGGGGVQ